MKADTDCSWFSDAILLVYGCISQVMKYLDQQNVSSARSDVAMTLMRNQVSAAYVSGMKEGESRSGGPVGVVG